MGTKYEQVETGIYRYVIPAKPGKNGKKTKEITTYHERPTVNGERTFRALGVNFTRQCNLKNAREEYGRRRQEVAAGRDPYSGPQVVIGVPTVGDIIRAYIAAGYPDKQLKPRDPEGRTIFTEKSSCETLLTYWDAGQLWTDITFRQLDKYHEFRVAGVKAGSSGDRTTEIELNSLSNAFRYARRIEMVSANPLIGRPSYRAAGSIKHCRDFAPQNAEELHATAAILFANPRSEVLGWKMLYEANTGIRTEEASMLRDDAGPGKPGHIAADGNLHLKRVKRGINPFSFIHTGLAELNKAHAIWKAKRYPNSHMYFPSRDHTKLDASVGKCALGAALRRLCKAGGKKFIPHGMRAWYVLIRRSQGISDAQIAIELGQSSGAALIVSTYGGVPANWTNGGGPNLKWLPEVPAWTARAAEGWKLVTDAKKPSTETPA